MVGLAATRMDDQSPLLKVLSVDGQLDKAGNVQSYLVKLTIKGEAVTLHLYNTTHNIIIQGKNMLSTFCQKVFVPFLEANSTREAPNIISINEQMSL